MKPSAYMSGAFVVLLGLTTCSLLVTVRADPRDTYTKLCQDQEIDLRRVSQIKPLVLFARSPESSSIGCDPEIKEAILDLEEPLEVDDPDNHCTVERVNRILGYLYKHIRAQNPTEEVPEPLQPIHTPKSLKRFFVGYALIVSKVCKLGMLKLLMKDTKQLIEKDDYSEVLLWTSGTDSQTKTFLGRAINYDDMFLVGSALCDSEIQTCRKLFVQNVYWERLRSMRNTCHRLFKPFYGQLIMPIVRLANAGIDYMDSELRGKLDDFRENPELQKWFKVVFLCESLANVVPLPALKEDLHHEVEIDEEALKKLDEEETKDELDEKKQEADDDGEVVQIVNLNEECPVPDLEDGNADKPVVLEKNPSTKDGVEVIEVVECQDGKKVLKVKKKSKKFLSSLFGKESYIAKELRKLQQERKAYLLSKKSMPVTNIMTKRDVAKYEQENGPIDYGFGIEPPIDYRPKPEIHINDDLMPQTDKRVARAIKKYETKKREWRKILRNITKKYVRLLRRITLLGRVKFGGKQKQKVDTDELMFKVFDHAMWRKENPEMVKQEKGKWRKILEFQNLSNVATCVSLALGVIFFILSCTLGLGR